MLFINVWTPTQGRDKLDKCEIIKTMSLLLGLLSSSAVSRSINLPSSWPSSSAATTLIRPSSSQCCHPYILCLYLRRINLYFNPIIPSPRLCLSHPPSVVVLNSINSSLSKLCPSFSVTAWMSLWICYFANKTVILLFPVCARDWGMIVRKLQEFLAWAIKHTERTESPSRHRGRPQQSVQKVAIIWLP